MLQMKCPECDGTISSPLLIEMGSITCNQCKENVDVKDVFVKTKSFTVPRDTLLQRVRHYRSILNEINNEKSMLTKSKTLSTTAQKTLEQYYAAMRELLEASRGNYRLPITQDLPLSIEWDGKRSNGSLLNLSTKGAAIKPQELHGFPQKGSEVKLQIALPDNTEPLSIVAEIAWTDKREKDDEQNNITMGVSFINVHEKIRIYIWDYIVGTLKNSQCSGNSNPSLVIS